MGRIRSVTIVIGISINDQDLKLKISDKNWLQIDYKLAVNALLTGCK